MTALSEPAGSAASEGTEPAYCDHCGEALAARDHASCRRLRELEPPRYCPWCRRRLIVQVVPRGWTARCSEHGELAAD
ncbi:MAG: hypothetical protein WAK18_15745 [Nocardioidaceae bacterium]